MDLWDYLEPLGFKSLPTAWLNLEPLEDFFESIIKQENISPFEFQRNFKKNLPAVFAKQNLLKKDELLCYFLEEIDTLCEEKKTRPVVVPAIDPNFDDDNFYLKILDRLTFSTRECEVCLNNLKRNYEVNGNTKVPSKEFVNSVIKCREVFNQTKEKGLLHNGYKPIKVLQTAMRDEVDFKWLNCVIHKNLVAKGITQFVSVILLLDWCQGINPEKRPEKKKR